MHNLKQRPGPEKERRDHNGEKTWWQPSLVLFGRLSGWIVGPVILAIIIGKWLDRKYGTAPWLFLVTVGVFFIVSMYGIVREGTTAMSNIGDKEKDREKNEESHRSDKNIFQ